MRLLLILFPVLLCGQQLFQASPALNYWVDSANGSDSNPPGLPYATLGKLQAIDAANPRQFWNLRKDSAWREGLNTPRNFTTVQRYGVGAVNPLLDGSVIAPSGSWSKTAGRTFVYEYPLATYTDTSSGQPRMWEDGGYAFPLATSLANCDATEGSYFYVLTNATTITWYVHPTGNGNPLTNGKIYEVNLYSGLFAASNNNTIIGIHSRRPWGSNGGLETGKNALVIDCQSSDGAKHNALIGPGTNVDGLELDEAYDGALGPNPLVIFGTFSGESSTIQDLNIHKSTHTTAGAQSGQAVFSHGSGTSGAYTFTSPTISGFGDGIAASPPLLTVNGGTFSVANGGAAKGIDQPVAISGITVTATTGAAIVPVASTYSVANSILTASGYGVINADSTVPVALSVTGSSLTGTDGVELDSSTATIPLFTGNDLSGITRYYFNLGAPTYSAIQSSDNNNFGTGLGTVRVNTGGSIVSYSLWDYQSLSGQDAHSTPLPVSLAAPLLHYNLVQGADPLVVYDGSGRQYNIPVVSNSPHTPAYVANGLSFDGSGSTDRTTSPELESVSSVSAVVVFNLASPEAGFASSLFSHVNWGLGVKANKVRAEIATSGTSATCTTEGTHTIVQNGTTWYMIHLTYDGTQMKSYVNGELDCTKIGSGSLNGANNHLTIGAYYSGCCNSNGIVADAAAWTYGLSAADVANDYAARKALLATTHPGVSLP